MATATIEREKATATVEKAKPQIIDQFLGDASFPIAWKDEAEKRLHFWYDDLHNPQPVSPMFFDLGGWWSTCKYMYRRFGVPFGQDWVAKTVDEYVHTAVVPREEQDAKDIGAYFGMVMPIYADKFLGWWKERLLPEIKRNFEYIDNYPLEEVSLAEAMIVFEDMVDIQERHFNLHWVLNLAQFQATMTFQNHVAQFLGAGNEELANRILISDEDRNWDSINELAKLKDIIKANPTLKAAFAKPVSAILPELAKSAEGIEFLKKIDAYKTEYGHKSMYAHEFVNETWVENPAPILTALKGYVETDYSYEADVKRLRDNRQKAIDELWAKFPKTASEEDRKTLANSLDLALKMTPLTPDHHFYMDQGTYARTHEVLMAIGRKLVKAGVLNEPLDIVFLKYDELRKLSANFELFDAKALVAERKAKRLDAFDRKARLWCGTIDHWSLYEEPYKAGLWGWPGVYLKQKERAALSASALTGLGVSAGIVEGVAHVVSSPAEFDQVKKGEILVCQMTSPAWVVLFTKISGLVTDSGGALSHPAVVSREFEIPAVVGTIDATTKIKTGDRVRVDGDRGSVTILS
jgi:pyruvate,water dikinase